MFIAHGPLSAIVIEKIRGKYFEKISSSFIPALIVLSLIFGILPDFDFFIQAARSQPSFLHHHLVTHTPIFWIAASTIIYLSLKLLEKVTNKSISDFLKGGGTDLISISFLIGTLSHIFSDMLTGYIMVFYPFSNQGFTLGAEIIAINPTVTYFIHPAMIIEGIIVALFLIQIGTKVLPYVKRNVNALSLVIAILGVIALAGSTIIYTSTYLARLPKDSQNIPNYDRDGDTIDDYMDPDFNNNGIDNLDDNDRELIVQKTKQILNSRKGATYDNGTLERFGWLSSYGIISTAYYEAGYTIEPVIKNHFKEDAEFRFNLKTLHQVLKDRGRLAEVSIDSIGNMPGRIFFISVEDRVINGGYIVDQNAIAIVLPKQKQLTVHTIDSIKEIYSEETTIEVER